MERRHAHDAKGLPRGHEESEASGRREGVGEMQTAPAAQPPASGWPCKAAWLCMAAGFRLPASGFRGLTIILAKPTRWSTSGVPALLCICCLRCRIILCCIMTCGWPALPGCAAGELTVSPILRAVRLFCCYLCCDASADDALNYVASLLFGLLFSPLLVSA